MKKIATISSSSEIVLKCHSIVQKVGKLVVMLALKNTQVIYFQVIYKQSSYNLSLLS